MKWFLISCIVAAGALFCAKVAFGPPARLIDDMAQPMGRGVLSFPPGAVPHESSRALQRQKTDAPTLFEWRCAACHGADGTGKSYVAAQPGMPEVNDLTTGIVTPDELYRILTEGRGAMPPHADRLSEEERRSLIYYITHTLHRP